MTKMGATTKLRRAAAIKRAVGFLGPNGYGLEIKNQAADGGYFEGGGGGVDVTACAEEKGTSVELESREWDYQVREFIGKIH